MPVNLEGFKSPLLATDIIIEYQGGIVLIERKNPPYGLALPGGFAEYGISLEDNARKEAKEETNLDVTLEKLLCVKSEPNRDPRGHLVSAVYVGKGNGELCAGDDAAKARVYNVQEVMDLVVNDELAFDHSKILKMYLDTFFFGGR